MSDNTPITQRLREHLKVTAAMLGHEPSTPLVKGVLAECDNIDAIHKALEDANAEMREFCNRLEDAADKREDVDLWGVSYTALPLDADGVPIHVGDEMQNVSAPASHGTVYRMELTCDGWWIYFRGVGMRPSNYRNHHEPTVMDVLDELLMNWPDCEGPEDELALKNRIAKRLQLVDGDA